MSNSSKYREPYCNPSKGFWRNVEQRYVFLRDEHGGINVLCLDPRKDGINEFCEKFRNTLPNEIVNAKLRELSSAEKAKNALLGKKVKLDDGSVLSIFEIKEILLGIPTIDGIHIECNWNDEWEDDGPHFKKGLNGFAEPFMWRQSFKVVLTENEDVAFFQKSNGDVLDYDQRIEERDAFFRNRRECTYLKQKESEECEESKKKSIVS